MDDLGDLPKATLWQQKDYAHQAEHWLWTANLILFFIAMGVLLYGILTGNGLLAVIMLGLMGLTFAAGLKWIRVPDTSVQEFRSALSHGEVLIMVDVPRRRVVEIENLVRKTHPEAVAGGTSWMVDALGI